MNNKYTWVIALVVLVAVLIAGYLLFQTNTNKQNSVTQNINTTGNTEQVKQLFQESVTLTSAGFNPQTITVKPGTRVVWLNKSGVIGTVNSDNHPTNLLFPFLNLGRFNDGSSVSTMFVKSGKYTYHNELNPDQRGTVIVQ